MVLENLDPTQMAAQMGGSALVGAVIGYAAKKVAKILAVIIGVELVVLKFLESRGVLTVNWERLVNASENASQQVEPATRSFVETFVSTAGIGASFAAGFFVGLKRA